MIEQLFHDAQAALFEISARSEHAKAATSLTSDALFPLKGSFYIYPDNDVQHPDETMVLSDQAGVLLIINDLFLRNDERFGDAENRKRIQQQCAALFHAYEDKKKEILTQVFS